MTQKYLTQKSVVISTPTTIPASTVLVISLSEISLRDSSILKGCVSIATFSAPSRVRASNDGDHRHLPASPVKSSVLCPCARTVSPVRGNHGPRAFLLQSQNDAEVFDAEVGGNIYTDNYPCVDGTGHFAEQISLRDSSILKGCVSIATFSAPSRVRASNDGDHRHLPASPVKSSVLCPCARTVSPVRGNHGPRAFLLQSQNDAEVFDEKSVVISTPTTIPLASTVLVISLSRYRYAIPLS